MKTSMLKTFNELANKLGWRIVASNIKVKEDVTTISFRIHFNELFYMKESDDEMRDKIAEYIPSCILVKHDESDNVGNKFNAIFYDSKESPSHSIEESLLRILKNVL
jgi:hypothetical protein